MDKQSFFELLLPVVKRIYAEGSPVFPSVRLAQSWLETGGNIPYWNNLAGYKVGAGVPNGYWKGAVVDKRTWEVIDGRRVTETATFRAYDSIYDFYKDQDLLFARSRYDRVRLAKTPFEQVRMLLACGYATDPAYADKLTAIIKGSNLTQYDNKNREDEPMTAEEKKAFDELQKLTLKLKSDNDQLKIALLDQTNALKELQLWALKIDASNEMDAVPEWAKDAVTAAVKAKLIDTPNGGSYDFYRLLSVLYRKKLI
ncbi:glycoside hydrolase family 73 protein [Paenibacillus lignilyticus]|uniref:Glucosaminidase domain-containing protein n=1 Tax=Paenibacillus lignilyticus TaxID=1172615 RepID=A0ABS5CF81_9BACL|nr:glucosaminidase domain-containing protein [Paenibacillus lignilyticus]MBP3964524.1 glucosaminidase domain-containing protein [Paenibacillus lignilyticus]